MGVRSHTLRSTRNVVFLVTFGEEALELVDHIGITSIHVVGNFISLRICWVSTVEVGLDVEIESVDRSSTERTRSTVVDPSIGLRAECSPKEVGKVDGGGGVGNPVVDRIATSNGEEDFGA